MRLQEKLLQRRVAGARQHGVTVLDPEGARQKSWRIFHPVIDAADKVISKAPPVTFSFDTLRGAFGIKGPAALSNQRSVVNLPTKHPVTEMFSDIGNPTMRHRISDPSVRAHTGRMIIGNHELDEARYMDLRRHHPMPKQREHGGHAIGLRSYDHYNMGLPVQHPIAAKWQEAVAADPGVAAKYPNMTTDAFRPSSISHADPAVILHESNRAGAAVSSEARDALTKVRRHSADRSRMTMPYGKVVPEDGREWRSQQRVMAYRERPAMNMVGNAQLLQHLQSQPELAHIGLNADDISTADFLSRKGLTRERYEAYRRAKREFGSRGAPPSTPYPVPGLGTIDIPAVEPRTPARHFVTDQAGNATYYGPGPRRKFDTVEQVRPGPATPPLY